MGALTLATLLIAVFVLRFVDKRSSASGGYTVYLLMDDINGIAKRSNVRIAGIPVGYVENIQLAGNRARLDLRIQPEVALYEDATAARVARNLLGESFIGLTPGTPGKRKLKDGDQILNIAQNVTPEELMQNLSRIAQTVERITTAIEASVATEESQRNMHDILANLAEVTARLNDTVAENRASIRNILSGVEDVTTRGREDAIETLQNLRVATGEFRRLMTGSPNGEPGVANNVQTLAERLNRSSTSLEKTLQNL
ncbi:MAG TPA: MlaD family protein, partial [Polyangiaceae bacterium]|nr:MlaD family protein [Polyangiaceae bacterium]